MSSIYSLFFPSKTTSASPHLVKSFPVRTVSFTFFSLNALPNILLIAAVMYPRNSKYSSWSHGAPRKNSFPGESFLFSTKRTSSFFLLVLAFPPVPPPWKGNQGKNYYRSVLAISGYPDQSASPRGQAPQPSRSKGPP